MIVLSKRWLSSSFASSTAFSGSLVWTGSVFSLLLTISLLGCSPKANDPGTVREKAADATAEIKRDTKAIAQGIHDGWTRDKTVDLNSATKEQFQSLPGVSDKTAENIISHRPYAKVSELLERHVLSKAEYDKIEDLLTVKH